MNILISIFTYLTFISFSFGQLGRMSFFNQRVNIYAYEPIFFLISLLIFLKYKEEILKEAVQKWKGLLIFLLVTIFSFVITSFRFSFFDNALHSLYLVRLIMYLFSFLCVLSYAKKYPTYRFILSSGLGIVIIFTAVSSLFQYFLYPDLRNLLYLGWDQHLFRSFGLFFDTSVAGAIYGLIFLHMVRVADRKGFSKWIVILMSFVYLILITLSYSRALYVSMFFVLMIFFLGKKNIGRFVLILVIAIFLFFAFPRPYGEGVHITRLFSIVSRLQDYQEGINIWLRQPVFGIGYNRIRAYKLQDATVNSQEDVSHSGASFHSSYLILLVTTGIGGFLVFILFMKDLFVRFSLSYEFILLISLLSFFDNILLHPFVLFLLIQLLAIHSNHLSGKLQKE